MGLYSERMIKSKVRNMDRGIVKEFKAIISLSLKPVHVFSIAYFTLDTVHMCSRGFYPL